jgi:hypothetical protein
MKHIKYIESFSDDPILSFDMKTLKNNINGLLVELRDQGFSVFVSLDDSEYNMSDMKLNINIFRRKKFKILDIKDYIDTVIDFITHKYKYNVLEISTSNQRFKEYDKIDFDDDSLQVYLEFEYFKTK